MSSPRETSPRRIRARELGSGTVDTSVMVTVVLLLVNVHGQVKLGESKFPMSKTRGTKADQHGPVSGPPVDMEQPVELPLRPNSVIGPAEEVARVKVVVSTTSWKLGKSNITSTLSKEDVIW
jgi:hypothetical protein